MFPELFQSAGMRLKAYIDYLILSSQKSWEAVTIIIPDFWIGNWGSGR